jgi:hypothetical protein
MGVMLFQLVGGGMPIHRLSLAQVQLVDSLVEDAPFKVPRDLVAGGKAVFYISGKSHVDCLTKIADGLEKMVGAQCSFEIETDWSNVRVYIERLPRGKEQLYDGVGVLPIIQTGS